MVQLIEHQITTSLKPSLQPIPTSLSVNSITCKNMSQTRTRFCPTDDYYDALKSVMNNEFEKAETLISKTKDFCPIAQYLSGMSLNMKAMASQNRKEKEKVLEIASTAQETAANILKRDADLKEYIKKMTKKDDVTDEEKKNWAALIEIVNGDAILMRAMTQFHNGNYIKGAWNMRSAWKSYEAVLKKHVKDGKADIHPEIFACLKFGVGVFYYIVGLMPGVLQTLLSWIGFVADYDVGVQYLNECYQADCLKSPFAALILCMSYLFMPSALTDFKDNLKKATPIIKYADENFPKGTMFSYMASQYQRKSGNIEKAIERLEEGIKSLQQLGIEPNLFIWELANCHFTNLDFKSALVQLEKIVLKDNNDFEHMALCVLQLAMCYTMTGDKDKSTELLNSVKKYTSKKSRFDLIAQKKAKQLLSAPNFEAATWGIAFEMLYFRRDIAHMKPEKLKELGEKLDKLKTEAKVNLTDLDNLDEENVITVASILVIEGAILRGCGETEKAKQKFQQVLSLESHGVSDAKHYMVSAAYELGEMAFREGDFEQAHKYLTKANKYSKYDWEDVNQSRITKAVKQLKNEMKKKK